MFNIGDTITLGITVTRMGAQVNPKNGVKVTVKQGENVVLSNIAMTSGKYDEKNSIITGQYFYHLITTSLAAGTYTTIYTIDPGGSYEGKVVTPKAFVLG